VPEALPLPAAGDVDPISKEARLHEPFLRYAFILRIEAKQPVSIEAQPPIRWVQENRVYTHGRSFG
jgi:hypothetical protein